MDTKSSDKRTCLLHYIVATIRQKFPDLLNFECELHYIEKAAMGWSIYLFLVFTKFLAISCFLVSIENISTDVHELEKGMDAVRKEAEIRGRGNNSLVLRDFLANTEDKLRRLRSDFKLCQEVSSIKFSGCVCVEKIDFIQAFRECVEYFADSARTTDANTFFSLLVRFVKSFKVSQYYYKYFKS